MTTFTFYQPDNAPAAARAVLAAVQQELGFIPGLLAGLAESPSALKAYLQLTELLDQSSLSPAERHIAALSASVENRCDYCVPFHTHQARSVAGLDGAVIDAARAGKELPDPRLDALAVFTRTVVQKRGWVTEGAVAAFLEAGFSRANALDVVLAVTLKTLSNYSNRILRTPLDDAFADDAWAA
ncbi:carboxymuconolactone decarboxylase family protein [Methylococcus sp. EFPC2]|uniref:carboxymuconolactone decarboxylase family protein n=1 Tax=Methylococcus sp. EFPC2 TaxID=2812648 RepID=UPI001966CF11|nr:carboxymuconolactone decarboxylase family protein [Methylococcus sp. EFPC2]QSA96311.1 carboxymuconolactone decarboxylase family protein [Methylococcus sp. EFPC2]